MIWIVLHELSLFWHYFTWFCMVLSNFAWFHLISKIQKVMKNTIIFWEHAMFFFNIKLLWDIFLCAFLIDFLSVKWGRLLHNRILLGYGLFRAIKTKICRHFQSISTSMVDAFPSYQDLQNVMERYCGLEVPE